MLPTIHQLTIPTHTPFSLKLDAPENCSSFGKLQNDQNTTSNWETTICFVSNIFSIALIYTENKFLCRYVTLMKINVNKKKKKMKTKQN